MDTVLQHARMFGYRQKLMPYTRVFLPDSLGARFHFIHVAEQNLRRQLTASGGKGTILVETMSALRATRLNVLDTRNLAAYEAGDQIFPGAASFERKDLNRAPEIEAAVKRLLGGTLRESEYVPVALTDLISLLRQLPFNEELANMWDPDMLSRVLERMSARYEGRGLLYYRSMRRTKDILGTGVLNSAEVDRAGNQGAPVLCVFRDDGRAVAKAKGRPYWYPTLVWPATMATQLFNTTP
jgi:hypothetical protein